jgi:hypothetical protein
MNKKDIVIREALILYKQHIIDKIKADTLSNYWAILDSIKELEKEYGFYEQKQVADIIVDNLKLIKLYLKSLPTVAYGRYLDDKFIAPVPDKNNLLTHYDYCDWVLNIIKTNCLVLGDEKVDIGVILKHLEALYPEYYQKLKENIKN